VLFEVYFLDKGMYDDGSTWENAVDSRMFILDGHHNYCSIKI